MVTINSSVFFGDFNTIGRLGYVKGRFQEGLVMYRNSFTVLL